MSNVDPKYWGEGLWKFMYSIAASLNDKTQPGDRLNAINTFFNILYFILPCDNCSSNYLIDFDANPLPQNINKQSLFKWINDLENKTNDRIGKPHVALQSRISELENHSSPKDTLNEDSVLNKIPVEDINENVFGTNDHIIVLSNIVEAKKIINNHSTFNTPKIDPGYKTPQDQVHKIHQYNIQKQSIVQQPQISQTHQQIQQASHQHTAHQKIQQIQQIQQISQQQQPSTSQQHTTTQPHQQNPTKGGQNIANINDGVRSKIQNHLQKQNQQSKSYLQNRYVRSVQTQKMKAMQQVQQIQQRLQPKNKFVGASPSQAKIVSLSSPMKTIPAKEKYITPKKPCNCGKKTLTT